jgi:hypothetical protein
MRMKLFGGFKALTALGLLMTLSLGILGFAGTASAISPLSAVTCSHLLGSSNEESASLSGCSAVTGGSGTIASFTAVAGNITWTNGSTTDYTSTYTTGGAKCPGTVVQVNVKGTVTSSTNASIPEGALVKMTVCYNESSGKLKSAHGTVVKF